METTGYGDRVVRVRLKVTGAGYIPRQLLTAVRAKFRLTIVPCLNVFLGKPCGEGFVPRVRVWKGLGTFKRWDLSEVFR